MLHLKTKNMKLLNNTLRSSAMGLTSFMLTGCALNMGMVNPAANLRNVGSFDEPLQVYLDDSIKSDFDVQTAELKTAHLKDYRKSLEEGFKSSFDGVFQSVTFTESIPKSGYAIHLQKAIPKHVVLNEFQTAEGASMEGYTVKGHYVPGYSYETARTTYEIGVSIAWSAVLYRNGARVGRSEGKLVSEDRAQNVSQAPLVLKNALELMFEKIGNDLFTAKSGQAALVGNPSRSEN